MFGDEQSEISKYIFEFIIEVVNTTITRRIPEDKKVGITVVAIFKNFYEKYGDAISIYICDTSDGKELARKRKFDGWFSLFNDENFVKVDQVVLDSIGNMFPISLIISKSNPKKIRDYYCIYRNCKK